AAPGGLLARLPGAQSARTLLFYVVAAQLALFLFGSLFDIILTRASLKVGQRMVYNLAADLFAAIQRRSLLFHTRTTVGDSMSRITGDCWVFLPITQSILFGVTQALALLLAVAIILLWTNWQLGVISILIAPLAVAATRLLARRTRDAARARREVESRLASHV